MEDKVIMKGIERIAELLRQEKPTICCGTSLEIAKFAMFYFAEMNDLSTVSVVIDGTANIKSLEEAYEKGYAAIINDGKLLGFKYEKKVAL